MRTLKIITLIITTLSLSACLSGGGGAGTAGTISTEIDGSTPDSGSGSGSGSGGSTGGGSGSVSWTMPTSIAEADQYLRSDATFTVQAISAGAGTLRLYSNGTLDGYWPSIEFRVYGGGAPIRYDYACDFEITGLHTLEVLGGNKFRVGWTNIQEVHLTRFCPKSIYTSLVVEILSENQFKVTLPGYYLFEMTVPESTLTFTRQ